MSSQGELYKSLEQLFWNEMACGYNLYQYSVLHPLFLRTLLPLQQSIVHTRPYHLDKLTRSLLTASPDLALAAFNLHYRQFSYVLRVLPSHLLYMRVFRMIQHIAHCTPRDVFYFLTGLELDPLYSTLVGFIEAFAPLFTAYTARIFQLIPQSPSPSRHLSRFTFHEIINRYQVTYSGTTHELYHDLLLSVFHVLRMKHWMPIMPIGILSPSLRYVQKQSMSMTFPLPDRIMILLSPRTVMTHVDALKKFSSFTHEIGHVLQMDRLITRHHPMFQIDTLHPEFAALLLESMNSVPSLLENHSISSKLALEIAFYEQFFLLLRCLTQTGRLWTLLNCFRLPQFSLSAFRHIIVEYFHLMTRLVGYPVTNPPPLNPYSIFYDLDSVLGYWVTGMHSIENITNLGVEIPITTDYHSFLRKKWAFLDSMDEKT